MSRRLRTAGLLLPHAPVGSGRRTPGQILIVTSYVFDELRQLRVRPRVALVAKYVAEFRRTPRSLVMGCLRVLSSGVDTLHCSVRGELQDGLLVFLEALKREAQSSKEPQVVTWGEQSVSVALRLHGWRGYSFWASSPNIEVAIGAPSLSGREPQ